ncbi:MAG: WD40 repeat domain-containing protein, partial [Anaerolineales bacterium]
VTGSSSGEITLWDAETLQPQEQYQAEGDRLGGVALHPHQNSVLLSMQTLYGPQITSSEFVFWDAASQAVVWRQAADTSMGQHIALSPDGGRFIAALDDHAIGLWDVGTGQLLRRYDGRAQVRALGFHRDGRRFMASDGANIFLWDVESPTAITQYEGNAFFVSDVVFSPHADHLISIGISQTEGSEIVIMEMGSGEILRRFTLPTATIQDVVVPINGSIITATTDGNLFFWRYESLDQLQTWARTNRYLPTILCGQRRTFNMTPCVDDTPPAPYPLAPTRTPHPDPTPILATFTPPPSPTITDTPAPTSTPTATATPAATRNVGLGVTEGEITTGDRDIVQYRGARGEMLTISVTGRGFDARPYIYTTSGELITSFTYAMRAGGAVENFVMPADEILIEIRNERGSGWEYTLRITEVDASSATPIPPSE